MYRRSRAREVALQILFQRDANPTIERKVVEKFVRDRLRDGQSEAYCLRLVDGVGERGPDVDKLLTDASDNWRLARMAAVDRNVLRLGVLELLLADAEAPPAVVLNEAVELAKRFGSVDSPSFVNGVLDKVHRTLTPAS